MIFEQLDFITKLLALVPGLWVNLYKIPTSMLRRTIGIEGYLESRAAVAIAQAASRVSPQGNLFD